MTPSEDPASTVSLDPKSARYTRELTDRVLAALGDKLVGVYLHGSAVLGDFARQRSDIDVVAVSNGPLTSDEINVLAERLSSASLPCPARGLELHVVDRRTVEELVEPPFELHIATIPHRVVVGHGHGGDADLVMHYAVLCDRGVALTGPPASEVFTGLERKIAAGLRGRAALGAGACVARLPGA